MTAQPTTSRPTRPEAVDRSRLLRAVDPTDPYVRWQFPHDQPVRGWRLGRSVCWHRTSRRRGGSGWLTAVGDDVEVHALVSAARAELGSAVAGATLPITVVQGAPDVRVAMRKYNAWDWFVTTTAPPRRTGEALVRWAVADDGPAIAALLDSDSPRHSARPGDADVVGWCVLRAPDGGELLAAAANTELVPGVPHLASIVTRADQRGRGLGAAVTAWLTRQILAGGAQVVTLGMYADNEPARQMYRRLGYADTHHFGSGWLAESPSA